MNTIIKSLLSFFSFGFIFFIGCDESPSGFDYQKEVVVSGTLVAGQSVDTLKLHWTGEVDKFYDRNSLAISDAIVLIQNADGTLFDSLAYDPANPGRYYSIDSTRIIEPAKTYKLYVKTTAPDMREITGTTTVPDTFSIISATVRNNDTLKYDVFAPVNEFYWTPSKFAATYLPTVFSLDQDAAMIPKAFYPDTSSEDFQRPDKIGYRVGLPKEQTNTVLPWVFLSYYGKTQFEIYAVDENYNDFLNQVAAQGGELKEIRYKLNGGIGLFGSKTQAKNGITVYLVP